jgi:two-component system response regulator (stage 0 sporulation protein F)
LAKILIVDWEEEERVYFWSVLEDAGHELFFAADGKAALEVWSRKEVDLVLTELYLPELNGLRLIRELIARDPYGVVVAISEISADQLDLAEDYGACHILYKPVDPETLLAGIDQALEGHRSVRRFDWMQAR